ncbi:MAG: KpsF/GutQ family sugar-phosphate isomerase [Phycisphaerales bacterium]
MPHTSQSEPRAFARGVLEAESKALADLASSLGPEFDAALDLIVRCADRGGTVLVTGLGKSGHVGAKISATMASLGIPSHPVHPTEAAHGDLGRFRPADLVLALSYSGETEEVVALAAILRQDGLPIISITGGGRAEASSLERLATVPLRLGIRSEAGAPFFVAPTSSTTATLALGDALALAAAKRRNFTDEDFARRHPGGALGELLRPVRDVMRFASGRNMPLIPESASVIEAQRLAAAGGRRPGAIVIVARDGTLTGVFTDGDLRRLILRDASELSRPIAEVMTRAPRCLPDSALVRDAIQMFREHRQDEIPIIDDSRRPVGMLDVQDLIAMRLIKD